MSINSKLSDFKSISILIAYQDIYTILQIKEFLLTIPQLNKFMLTLNLLHSISAYVTKEAIKKK